MTIYTELLNYKDSSEVGIEYLERDCFTTDNFFTFWEKFKENYSNALVEVTSLSGELSNFLTDSEEILYIKYNFNYTNSFWQVRACDLIGFLNAKNFYCGYLKTIYIHNIYQNGLPYHTYKPWTPESEDRICY